jgi:hypothetical protein
MTMLIALIALAAPASTTDAENYVGKLHPVEAFCIDYDSKNSIRGDGWLRICSRNFGDEVVTISYSEGKGGNLKTGEEWTEVCKNQTIQLRAKQYVFDLMADQGVLIDDELYPTRVAAAKAYFEEGSAAASLNVWGYLPTGAVGEVVGIPCKEYEIATQQQTACFTDDLLMLKSAGPFFSGLVATKVTIGNGGDDEDYRLL